MNRLISFSLLMSLVLGLSFADETEKIAKKMRKAMYNAMDEGLKGYECIGKIKMTQPFPLAVLFSIKVEKGKAADIKIKGIEPKQYEQFIGMIQQMKFDKMIAEGMMSPYADMLDEGKNKVKVKEEGGKKVILIIPKDNPEQKTKLWLNKDYSVQKVKVRMPVPDAMDPSQTREMDTESELIWKKNKKGHLVLNKVKDNNEMTGEQERNFTHTVVDGYTLPASMSMANPAFGNLVFKFSDYKLQKE